MKRPRFKKRTWVLAALVTVVAAMASIGAYAYWTTSARASGSATTGTVVDVVVNQTSDVRRNALPGRPDRGAVRQLRQPERRTVWIASVTAVVSSVTPAPAYTLAGNGKPDCVAVRLRDRRLRPGGRGGSRSGLGQGSWSV